MFITVESPWKHWARYEHLAQSIEQLTPPAAYSLSPQPTTLYSSNTDNHNSPCHRITPCCLPSIHAVICWEYGTSTKVPQEALYRFILPSLTPSSPVAPKPVPGPGKCTMYQTLSDRILGEPRLHTPSYYHDTVFFCFCRGGMDGWKW